jgi:hypothetical protein
VSQVSLGEMIGGLAMRQIKLAVPLLLAAPMQKEAPIKTPISVVEFGQCLLAGFPVADQS